MTPDNPLDGGCPATAGTKLKIPTNSRGAKDAEGMKHG
jgi:hypothetical protein